MKYYKWKGKFYIEMREYTRSRKYLKKMLIYSWALNKPDVELSAFDLIGITYYYQQNMSDSKYFHERMSKGIVEEENTYAKKIGNVFFEYHKKKCVYKKKKYDLQALSSQCNIYFSLK